MSRARKSAPPPAPTYGPRVMVAEDMGLGRCRYGLAYSGNCGALILAGHYCVAHVTERCTCCGEQATHECSHAGQFVCGYPLCNDCWHCDRGHERRPDAPPLRKLHAADIGVAP